MRSSKKSAVLAKSINTWFDEYQESHQHPVNIAIHWVAVPVIMFTILGFLWAPPFLFVVHPLLNWASVIGLLVVAFYARLSKTLAIGLTVIILMMLCALWWLSFVITGFMIVNTLAFVAAWILQFIGHRIEGKRPSFLKDVQFLLIGPLWLLAKFYRKVRIPW